MDSGRLQPALLGGVFIGVLSGLPIVNAGNCCCCLWVIAGGVLAVYLRQQNLPAAVASAEGALLGLLAGAIGGVISAIISTFTGPIQFDWMVRVAESMGDVPPEVREGLERARTSGATMAGLIGGMIFSVVVYGIFGMLGGLLGVAIFKKNAPPPPPTVIEHDPGTAR
ncbi:MAG TPA: hypothetical protein VM364_05425 [Vicinamibacterales bacterium]|nr:hypothetical protein [Vicinamibacterales bacterium]